jgi:hypothetical protein
MIHQALGLFYFSPLLLSLSPAFCVIRRGDGTRTGPDQNREKDRTLWAKESWASTVAASTVARLSFLNLVTNKPRTPELRSTRMST